MVHNGADYQVETYNRCSKYLRVKLVTLPQWFVDWQEPVEAAAAAMKEEAAAKEEKVKAEKANRKAERATHDVVIALGDGADLGTSEPGLTDADVAEGAATNLAAAKKESRTTFEVGDDVLVPGKKKTDPKFKGRITKVITKECWVEFEFCTRHEKPDEVQERTY